jgi:cytochrome P450
VPTAGGGNARVTHDDQLVYYDPYDVEINKDPYPTYARLRSEAPLYYNERYDFWAISRHKDVEHAFLRPQIYGSCRSDILDIIQSGVDLPSGVVMWEDPPIHTMHRGLMNRVFTPKAMAALEDQVRSFCASCLDPLRDADGFDIIAELGAVMPMRVIGMLLGIPDDDQMALREHADAALRTTPGQPMQVNQETIASGNAFEDYIDWRATHPSDDLMTSLLNAEFEDETGTVRKLSRDEVLTYTGVLAGAGNETSGRLIGWLTKLLAEYPEARREVTADRSLLKATVEETLRFEPPGPHFARYLLEDIELYDTLVPAGSAMMLLPGSANRDPDRYENPDSFDIHRDNIQHFTFGFGIHLCLGAHLARLEGRVALDEMLNRFNSWSVDYDQIQLSPTSTVRGWERLPIVIG